MQSRSSSPLESDAVLAARVAVHEAEAWGLLYDRYAPSVFALAAHTLGRAHAEELVQDVFLRLWRTAPQFDPDRGAFRTWFLTGVRNRIWDELRSRSREERLLVAGEVEQLLSEAADPGVDVEELVYRRERGRAVLRALQCLPAEQRRVLVLAYFGGGLSHAAIAEHLGLPLGTVKKRTRLGLQKLRALLGDERTEGHQPVHSLGEGGKAAYEL